MRTFKTLLRVGAVALFFCAHGASAAESAAAYPTKPIRLIVPWAPGAGLDILARTISPKMTEALGQQVVVDNRPGASSIIGTELVARATPDGYTLILASTNHSINPALWSGIMVPRATPREIIVRLNTVLVRVLALPDVKEKLTAQGAEVTPSTPDAFGKLVVSELDRLGKLAKAANMRVD